MFNKIRAVSLLLVLAVVFAGACGDDFLDVAPTGSLTESQLTSAPGIDGAVVGAYSYLLGRTGFYSDVSNWFWGGVRGGDANKGSDPGDQSQVNEIERYETQTNNSSVLEKYSRSYEGVARSNAAIGLAQNPKETVSEQFAIEKEAEARFLRGVYYFELKKNFDDSPYVDETWDGSPVQNDQDLWQFIEADFEFAFQNLPATQSDAGRANKWAARAFQGKTFLFQQKWSQAKAAFDDVIANGVTAQGEAYGLMENYQNLFRATFDNNKESIFAVQAAAGTGNVANANPAQVLNFPHGSAGPARPGGCCGFNQPSFELANSFRTDDNGLPLLDGSYNDGSNALVNDFGLSSDDPFTPDAGPVDPRLDHSVGRRGIPYLDWGLHPGNDWIRQQSHGGPYSPKKFSYYQGGIGTENDGSSWTPGYTTVNYVMIRFADVLLMAAEAEIELGNVATGIGYINQVRERAANSVLLNDDGTPAANYNVGLYSTGLGQDEARQALRFERKLELSGEGHRFYDLVRWGVAESVLNDYLAHENQFISIQFSGARFDSGRDEFLPIPQAEIDLQGSDVLAQNPGY